MITQQLGIVPLVAVPKRTDTDVAEDLYVPEEKTNAVLRSMIDQLDKALTTVRLEIKELNAKVDDNHRTHNGKHHEVDRQLVVLVGDGDLSEGLVRNNKSALKRVWKKFEDHGERIEKQNENTWKLKLALVAGSLSTGGGVMYGLMRLLGT
jgi:hypothetical protein